MLLSNLIEKLQAIERQLPGREVRCEQSNEYAFQITEVVCDSDNLEAIILITDQGETNET